MDFGLADALDVLPFGLKAGCTAVTIEDEDLWKADAISIWKTVGTPHQEAKSFKEFEKLLPQLKQVKKLYVGYRTSESLFDAICKMDRLERLEIYQASQKSLESITNLQQLTHLEIGSCPHLDSLAPLSKLKRLKALGMKGSFRKITHLDPLAELVQLNGLALRGGDSYFNITILWIHSLALLIYSTSAWPRLRRAIEAKAPYAPCDSCSVSTLSICQPGRKTNLNKCIVVCLC